MIVRRFFMSVLVATLVAGACGGDPPPPPAPPAPDQDSLQRYRDSVAAAERARAEAEAREAAERAAREARERAIREARETLEARVYFDYDESEIEPTAQQLLREKAEILRASPQVRLRIEGHADERGSTEYNLALGNRRAEAVRQFLTDFGLSGDRFETVSFGEGRPVATGSSEQAWEQNRRAEFVITAGANQINPPSN